MSVKRIDNCFEPWCGHSFDVFIEIPIDWLCVELFDGIIIALIALLFATWLDSIVIPNSDKLCGLLLDRQRPVLCVHCVEQRLARCIV
jgi:hypothetical protein